MMKIPYLVLVDNNVGRRAAICHCLAGCGLHIEPFENPAELVGHWPRSSLVLVHDEGASVRSLIQELELSGTWLPVVGFAEKPATRNVVQAMHDGAFDYVSWPFAAEEIVTIVDEAETKAETVTMAKQREALARRHIEQLTRRERDVLAGVVGGLSSRQIGERLEISPRTVEIHRSNMLKKMGTNRTSEAIRIAIEASMLD